MKLISAKHIFNAVRLKGLFPKFVRHARFDYNEATINGEKVLIYLNPNRYGVTCTAYFNFNEEAWFIPEYKEDWNLEFFAEVKAKQVRKQRKKTEVPFNFNRGVDIQNSGEANCCTVRATSIAFDIPFIEAHALLKAAGRKDNDGFPMKDFLVPQLRINNYICGYGLYPEKKLTLRKFLEENPKGRYIVTIRSHALAVIDGTIHDTFVKPRAKVKGIWKIHEQLSTEIL